MCKIKSIYTSIYFAIIIVPHIFRYVLLLLKNFLVINRIISLISYKSFIVVHTVLNFISSHPYFNGYCSYTRCSWRRTYNITRVSILILMDIALILVHTQLIAITHIQQSLKNFHYKNMLVIRLFLCELYLPFQELYMFL